MITISRNFSVLSTAALLFAFAPAPALAADAPFTDAQKTEIQALVRDYIINNPQVILESVQRQQENERNQRYEQASKKATDLMPLLHDKDLPTIGNPKGDVKIVEFFDYNCGYCKHALLDVEKLTEADKNVQFIFQELPVLGRSSELAARWSQAAHKQGKFFDFHRRLMKNQGTITEDTLVKIIKDLGLDADKAKKDAESEETTKAIDKSRALALELEINGTPGFVVGNKIYPGYLGEEGFKKAIETARAENKPEDKKEPGKKE